LARLKGDKPSFKRYFTLAVLIGMPLSYIGGALSLYIVNNLGIEATFVGAVLPFIPGDIIKAAAGAYLAVKLNKIFAK
jgi:biotin transport system substrate-specific component